MRNAPRGRKRSKTASGSETPGIVAGIAALLAGFGAYFAGLGIGGSIGVAVLVFIVLATAAHLLRVRSVTRRMERLIDAGDYKAARRIGERAAGSLGKEPRFAALFDRAKNAESQGSVEPEPPSADESAGRVAPAPPLAPLLPQAPGPSTVVPEPPAIIPEPPPGPAEPVASPLAGVAVALLVPALVPVLGAVAAPALLVVCLLLLRRERLAWDRRIAMVGATVAVLAILASGVGVLGFLGGGGLGADFPEISVEPTTRMQVLMITALILSVVAHEVAHGVAARISGDPTAEEMGRLSLNPIRHIDPFGSVILPVLMSLTAGFAFGWAKPVPVNPARFRRRRAGGAFVSVAGVGANAVLALGSAALLILTAFAIVRLCPDRHLPALAHPLAPIHAEWLPGGVVMEVWIEFLKAGILINLILASLNLLPIPPLDGAHLVRSALPRRAAEAYGKLGVIGFPILIILVITDLISYVFIPGLIVAMILTALPGMLLPI